MPDRQPTTAARRSWLDLFVALAVILSGIAAVVWEVVIHV